MVRMRTTDADECRTNANPPLGRLRADGLITLLSRHAPLSVCVCVLRLCAWAACLGPALLPGIAAATTGILLVVQIHFLPPVRI